jgi:hypothetical protein
LESFKHVLRLLIIRFARAKILDRKKVIDQLAILIDITLTLLNHCLNLFHFILDVLWTANIAFYSFGLAEIEFGDGEGLRFGVDEAFFEDKVLVLHKCCNLFLFCNFGVLS